MCIEHVAAAICIKCPESTVPRVPVHCPLVPASAMDLTLKGHLVSLLEHWQHSEESSLDHLDHFSRALAAVPDANYQEKFMMLQGQVLSWCRHQKAQVQVLVTEGKALLGTHPKDMRPKDLQDDPSPKRTRFGGSSSSTDAAPPAVEVVSSEEEEERPSSPVPSTILYEAETLRF